MAGQAGRGRGRATKGSRVDNLKAEGSPVRRTTRQQQQQHQQAFTEEEEEEFTDVGPIDPSLHSEKDSSMPPPPPGLKHGQRGTRRDPERHASIGASLNSLYSPSDLQSSPNYATTQRLTSAPVYGTSVRGTSVSSFQANGIPGWKKKKVPRQLASLWQATKELYAHLYTHPSFRLDKMEFSSDEEADDWEAERESCSKPLNEYRAFFLRRAGDPVIHPNYVLQDMMGTEPSSSEGFRASREIYATNFVSLLEEALTIHKQDERNILAFLQSWDDWFPQVFFEGSEDCKEHSQRILEVVTGIRTQRLIFTLRDLQIFNKSPEEQISEKVRAVARIFCLESTPLQELIRDLQHPNMEIRRIPFIDIETVDNGTELRDQYTHRVREIVNILQESPDPSDLEGDFPFDAFLQDLRDFVVHNFERLQMVLDGNAGTDSARVEELQQIQSQLESEALDHALGRIQHGGSNGEVYIQNLQEVDRLQSQGIISGAEEFKSAAYHGSAAYPPGFGHSVPQPSGFQYAQSAAQVASMKRPAPDPPAPAPKKKAKRRKNAPEAVGAASGALVPVPEAQHSVPLRPQIEPDFEALSQRAREITAANRKPPKPQVRSLWVQADTKLLQTAVDLYKCKWSLMERAIKSGELVFQRPRDQQALRDKARLLKQDMLKSDSFLPASFDLVVLGKKERLAVIACGKNPDRKEADVDANGKPINTEYVEGIQQGEVD